MKLLVWLGIGATIALVLFALGVDLFWIGVILALVAPVVGLAMSGGER